MGPTVSAGVYGLTAPLRHVSVNAGMCRKAVLALSFNSSVAGDWATMAGSAPPGGSQSNVMLAARAIEFGTMIAAKMPTAMMKGDDVFML
jgi:hypothetical protein